MTCCLFFSELSLLKDNIDPTWREKTVIIIDNAAYHRSKMTMEAIESLRIPVLFSAPYSAVALPLELFFGAVKRALGSRTWMQQEE